MYSVKSVSVLTGLSADTLRAWERRYQVVTPSRDKNDRRVYGPEDVVRLRLLSSATDLGHPIGKLTSLDNNGLRAVLNEVKKDPQERQIEIVGKIVEAAKDYRADLIDEILGLAITGLSPFQAARDVLTPTLQQVGDLWQCSEMSIAQEHLVSSSVERLVLSMINVYQKKAAGPKILFCTFNGEKHRFGILLSAFVAASLNMRCYYFGTDLPAEEIAAAGKSIEIDLIALSFISQPISKENIKLLDILCREMKGHCQVWAGGIGAIQLPSTAIPDNCLIIDSLDDFRDRIDFFSKTQLSP